MRIVAAVLSTALLIGAGSAPAEADCKCRARGVVAAEGQTLCIRTPDGLRLARCGKVSNVASWTFLQGPCPLASLELSAQPTGAVAQQSFATR